MLDYETIKALINNLETDQAPVAASDEHNEHNEHNKIERTAYDEGRHIYSINFTVSLSGTVIAKVHVQWGLMKQLLLNKDRIVRWSASAPDVLHFNLRLASQPEVEYTTVLFKDDMRRLWQQDSSNSACPPCSPCSPCSPCPPFPPFPENEAVEDIWVKLFNRGGYTL